MHEARLAYYELAPKPMQGLLGLSQAVHHGALGAGLLELIFLRVSQINGCGVCVDMHWRDLIKQGQDARRVNAVAGWREAPFFTARERAALRWAELVTRIPQAEPSDDAFAELRAHFSDSEVAELGFAVATINAWNRLNVSFRTQIPVEVK